MLHSVSIAGYIISSSILRLHEAGREVRWRHSKARVSHRFHSLRNSRDNNLSSSIDFHLQFNGKRIGLPWVIRYLSLAKDAERQDAVALGCVNGLLSASMHALRAFYNGNRRKEVDH